MASNYNYKDDFERKGRFDKGLDGLNEEEVRIFQQDFAKYVRERAWAVGSPVYYSVNGISIAEYEDGRKMIVETVNGERVETGVYEGKA